MSNFSTSGSEGQCVWSWVGGDKEQSLVVSATDNERSVCLAGVDQVAPFTSRFLAPLLLLCFSLLSTFFKFIGEASGSCEG